MKSVNEEMWMLKKVLSQPSCSNFWTNTVRSHCIQFFSSFCYSSKGRTRFWGWGCSWKQSFLGFLRMRMRLKTICSWFLRMMLKTICAWVSEYEDEHGNDLCLGFWGWWWVWGVLSKLWFVISRCILHVCTDCQLSTICIRNCCLKGRSHVTEGADVYLALLSFAYLVVQYRVWRDEPCLLSLSQAHNSDSSHCLQKIWLPQIWLELRNADFV